MEQGCSMVGVLLAIDLRDSILLVSLLSAYASVVHRNNQGTIAWGINIRPDRIDSSITNCFCRPGISPVGDGRTGSLLCRLRPSLGRSPGLWSSFVRASLYGCSRP